MEDNKTKVSTLRVNLNDEEAFKQYLKDNGYTQAEGFKNLVALMELDNAKKQLNDRAKEIDTFKDTVNKLINLFINSLEVNQVAEERIREELNKELVTKDKTISSLQEQLNKQSEELKKLKSIDTKSLKESNQKLKNEVAQLKDKLTNANDMLVFYKEQVAELNEQVKMLMNKCVNNE
ncbi:MAG: hypothetical protein SOZ71_07330 [Clostridium sp.]|nr:hypothetical protein [Clostridium sp.]